jgi:hypothetical protein
MLKLYPGERWKELLFEPGALKKRYTVSNFGRVISFVDKMEEGRLINCGLVGGYPAFRPKPFGKYKTFYVHRLVGESFLSSPSNEHQFIIHIDHNKENNRLENLRYATKREMELHQQNSPLVKMGREKRKLIKPQQGHKLSSTDVMRIKKMIFNPNRKTRLKMIARQFNISEMQLYRIKSGENWGHIKVEGN